MSQQTLITRIAKNRVSAIKKGKHLPSTFRNKLIAAVRPNKIATVNFFADISDITGDRQLFPDDQDTTAVCHHALLATHTVNEDDLLSLSQSIYENVNDDGVLQAYYVSKDNSRYNRIDAVCIINILRFAYAQRHERFVQRSEDYVFDWLISGKYKSGTIYYPSAYTFLYFCSLLASTNYQTKIRFMDTLRREFDQIKLEDLKYPLDYAQTILTGAKIGLYDESLIEKLLEMQNMEDGSWPADALYCTHRVKVYYGSKSISTILSVLALMETV
ncbi:uncharacterized protein LOC119078158 [Bradysia coprophila]|uniref:uncharacterized protein LOC119078158 n=1 Tax=Bradysia coprophila TaxID=38358 RepID=UPI00187D9B90|nr:uncharacterized protein LOC119078158 [Bradysia coprophila]